MQHLIYLPRFPQVFPRLPAFFALICATVFLSVASALPAKARGLIRDADIEYALGQLAAPVLRSAELNPGSVRILLINDRTLNAFVTDPNHIFLHTGLLLKLESPAAFQAVIAHEAAHIANGHLSRRVVNFRAARSAAGLGLVLAGMAAASGNSKAAAGLVLGTQSSAMMRFFAHTRAEEASADQASLRSLKRAGIDPRGALEVLELFRGQEALSAGRQDPYLRTHPLTRDRITAVRAFVAAHGGGKGGKDGAKAQTDPKAAYWFARARGKLSAFQRAPAWTLRRAKSSPSKDIALMREAVAHHRNANRAKAMAAIDKAVALRPKDPFLQDLRGQILLESRQSSAAVAAYKRAVSLAPRNAQILGGYGRALLAAKRNRDAESALERARARDFRDPRILRDLAVAYAKNGKQAMASLATAERYALQGRMKDAALHAKRAKALLPKGSAPARRADDILNAARNAKRR